MHMHLLEAEKRKTNDTSGWQGGHRNLLESQMVEDSEDAAEHAVGKSRGNPCLRVSHNSLAKEQKAPRTATAHVSFRQKGEEDTVCKDSVHNVARGETEMGAGISRYPGKPPVQGPQFQRSLPCLRQRIHVIFTQLCTYSEREAVPPYVWSLLEEFSAHITQE